MTKFTPQLDSAGTYGNAAKIRLRRRFMAPASFSALSLILVSTAHARLLPGCMPTMPVAGQTVNCVAPAPTVIGPIATNVDNLTIVIGDVSTPTTVNGGINAVSLSGGVTVNSVAGTVTGGDDGISELSGLNRLKKDARRFPLIPLLK